MRDLVGYQYSSLRGLNSSGHVLFYKLDLRASEAIRVQSLGGSSVRQLDIKDFIIGLRDIASFGRGEVVAKNFEDEADVLKEAVLMGGYSLLGQQSLDGGVSAYSEYQSALETCGASFTQPYLRPNFEPVERLTMDSIAFKAKEGLAQERFESLYGNLSSFAVAYAGRQA